MEQQPNDLPENEISTKIKFCDLADTMEKISTSEKTPQKLKILEKFIKKFQAFQETFQKQSTSNSISFFPILRLLISSEDRERPSYGIQSSTMGRLYTKILGISSNSDDAATLMSKKYPYSVIAYSVLRKRCKVVSDNMMVYEVNQKLDSIADSYQNNNRSKIDEILTEMMIKMTAIEQKWLIAIILKEKILSTKQILQTYHPNAIELHNHFSNLSKVTEMIESGEKIELEEQPKQLMVEPFFHVKSMLCYRLKMSDINNLLSKNDFYSETKMDGERFQIHIKNGEFRYFSRNGFDFTKTYGNSRHEGSLSPSINSLFLMDVRNLILDGEMMVWNKANQTYHTKGENFDVKKLNPNDPSIRPCFVVYDLLFLNDDILINKPYAERVRILKKLFREQAGVMVQCERHKIAGSEDLLNEFNKALDNKEEGLVIKTLDSFYQPGERAGGWYKMKADYMDGIISDFDMLIIGGYYNEKGNGQYIDSYLLGVYQKTETENKFLSAVKVEKGLTYDERSNLNASLRSHWQKTKSTKVGRKTIYESPSFLEWKDSPPDVWIEPKNSIILEIKAAELVKTDTYRTNYTFRFPRITQVRSDKQWFDCCTLEEFDAFCTSDTKVQKIEKRHLTIDDLNLPAKRTKLQQKADLIRSPIKSAVLCKEDIVKLDNLLEGKNLCVMSSGKNYPSIEELEKLVLEHGGNTVKNPGSTTFAVIVGDITVRVKSIVTSNKYNVVSVDWLLRALTGQEKNKLLEFTPHDMICSKTELLEEFRYRFDEFGDSYTEPVDKLKLNTIMSKMTDLPYKILKSEIFKMEKILKINFNFFRLVSGYFFDEETFGIGQMALRLRGGSVCESIRQSHEITHIFVSKEMFDRKKLNDLVMELNLQNVKILSINWILKSNALNKLCKEDEFLIQL